MWISFFWQAEGQGRGDVAIQSITDFPRSQVRDFSSWASKTSSLCQGVLCGFTFSTLVIKNSALAFTSHLYKASGSTSGERLGLSQVFPGPCTWLPSWRFSKPPRVSHSLAFPFMVFDLPLACQLVSWPQATAVWHSCQWLFLMKFLGEWISFTEWILSQVK